MAQAFDLAALYAQNHRLVRWLVQGAGVPGHAVDDLVQDVFVAAHRRQAAAPDGDRRRWLVGVTRSICHSYRRSDARRRQRLERCAKPVDGAVDEATALQRLRAALATVSPAQREAFVLVDLQGLSAQEVASTLGVNLNTVYSRVRLARQRIVADLREGELVLPAARAEGRASRETQRRTWVAIAARVAVSKGSLGNVGGALLGAALGVPVLGVIMLVGRPAASGADEPAARRARVEVSAPVELEGAPLVRGPRPVVAEAPLAELRTAPAKPEHVAAAARSTRRRRPASAPSLSPLERETALLRSAAKALDAGRRDRGCALLARHRRQFPDGVLANERARLEAQPDEACVSR